MEVLKLNRNNYYKNFRTKSNFWRIGSYTRKVNFISTSIKCECYYIEKESYDDIIDKDENFLKPLKKMLKMKDITVSLYII